MQIIRRLALGIPTLILISSIVFFLSKIMPGTSGAYLLEDNMEVSSPAEFGVKEKIYQQYLQKTGQDKPLFYFSLASLAEPDTLFKVFPDYHQPLLRSLSFNFGNWPFIKNYYVALIEFQFKIDSDKTLLHLPAMQHFFKATVDEEIEYLLRQTEKFVDSHDYSEDVRTSYTQLKNNYLQMKANKKGYQKLIPAIHFHGTDNQYHRWLANLIKGDMGISLRNNRLVVDLIKDAIGITLLMTVSSLSLGWIISLLMALFINSPIGYKFEKSLLASLYILDVFPLFLISFLVLILFSGGSSSGLLPSFGLGGYQLIDNIFLRFFHLLRHLILPILCMTLVILPYLIGQMDRALKEVSKLEYIKTARAKGLSDFVVLTKHVLRNALTPLITIFTESLPGLISGALVVEVIFSIPGMGRLLVGAVNARDYPLVLGIVILVASIKILSNILADVLYRFSDPRIKLSE